MAHWHAQEIINEIEARLRNESLERTHDARGGDRSLVVDFDCECSYRGCASAIRMSRDEYESVRSDGTRFAIAINHENPEVDIVVAENGRFATVQKWLGAARRMTGESNPRR